MRRGAASYRAVLGSCPVAAAGRAAAEVPVTAEPTCVAKRPRYRDPGEVRRPADGRRSRGCPDTGQAGRCPVRDPGPAVGMSVQPVERTSSVHASGVHASGVHASGASGVRTDRPPVSAALSAPR